jgi:hypothetical protein
MIVTRDSFAEVLKDIKASEIIGFDTETYGVRSHDRMFALIVSTPKDAYYFNFNAAADHMGKKPDPSCVLNAADTVGVLRSLFDHGVWASHNAIFDLHRLRLEQPATRILRIHCTLITERLLRNDFMDYSLDVVAPRYGLTKSTAVDEYIAEHGLYTKVRIPGKKIVDKQMHFEKVPLEIMVEYATNDAFIHRRIAEMQRTALGLRERDEADTSSFKNAGAGNTDRCQLR